MRIKEEFVIDNTNLSDEMYPKVKDNMLQTAFWRVGKFINHLYPFRKGVAARPMCELWELEVDVFSHMAWLDFQRELADMTKYDPFVAELVYKLNNKNMNEANDYVKQANNLNQ